MADKKGGGTMMASFSWARIYRGNNPALFLLVLLWCVTLGVFVWLKPTIFGLASVTTILQFSTILALVALGQALVILSGGAGIDLSVGGMVSLSAVMAMLSLKTGLPSSFLPVVCPLIGMGLGFVNAVLVVRLRIFPLIATLGTFFVYSGLALALTGGSAQAASSIEWLLGWGRGNVFSLPLPFLTLVLPLFVLAFIMLGFTAWGRWIYASGYNEQSARLVGINVDKMRLILYSVSGLLAGSAGGVSIAWLGSARPNIGQNLELESLTSVMLGGFAISGGIGKIGAVLAAVILIVTLKTGLLQLNINTIWQAGIVGILLIFVLLVTKLAQIAGGEYAR